MEVSRKIRIGRHSNDILALALWRWGLPAAAILAFVVAVAHILAMFPIFGANVIADKSDGALKYLAFAVAALAILRAGNLLKAKFLGVEFEFESIADHANNQESAIQQLKTDILHLKSKLQQNHDIEGVGMEGVQRLPTSTSEVQMPELGNITFNDDKNKGRFGGSPAINGYRLSADFRFKGYDDPIVTVIFRVFRDDNAPIDRPVRFFLHETFGDRKEITVSPSEGKISLELLVYGGFTVGAWVEGTATLLELDLTEQRNAPSVIRNL
jgi:hypothetical protein